MKVELYARVSTSHQDVELQMRALRQWAYNNGHRIVNEVFDKQSGTVNLQEREAFLNILNNPKGEALCVFNLDRLSRYWPDEPKLESHFKKKTNHKLISLHDDINLHNANGRLMFRIKFAVNCQMPEDMKEKQAPGIAKAKAAGKYKGRQKGAKGKGKSSKY